MNIQLECQTRNCRETITEKDGMYCEVCYQKLEDILHEADNKIENLEAEIIELKKR
jgi:Zn finger protein HypA/HybF involved in hydrogenase expression